MVGMMGLTIRRQIEFMRRDWPHFRTIRRTKWFARWEGQLRPLCQDYTVQVAFCRQQGNSSYRCLPPLVTVIVPLLRRRSEDPGGSIPHHYPNPACPELPFLCLHYPPAREWDPRHRISATTVPWTIDWLACYEGWLATGKWTGGGVHPGGAP